MIQFRLADLRKKKGMTQQELADMLSVSYQTVSRWETGAVLPDVTVLPALSRIFKVSVDALLGLAPLEDDYERSMAGTGDNPGLWLRIWGTWFVSLTILTCRKQLYRCGSVGEAGY